MKEHFFHIVLCVMWKLIGLMKIRFFYAMCPAVSSTDANHANVMVEV